MRDAGDLNQVIVLKKRVPVTENGISRDDWEIVGAFAAEVLRQSAKAFYSAGAEYGEAVIIAHIRTPWRYKLTTGLRIVTDELIEWDTVDVIPNKPARGFTELRARRVSMEGVGIDA